MSSWFSSLSSSISNIAGRIVDSDTVNNVQSVTSRAYVSEVCNGLELVDPSKHEDITLIKEFAQGAELSRQVYNYTEMIKHEDCTLLRAESPVIVGYYERFEGTIWILCRGTHSPDCLILDFGWLGDVDYLQDTRIKVPKMIADVVQEQMHDILSYVKATADRNQGKVKQLKFTGHSLGGSVATAMYLSYRSSAYKPADIHTAVYTFGAPSICLDQKPSLSEDHVHHLCYQLDLVPRLVGEHDIPPGIVLSDFGRQLLQYSQRESLSRKHYRHWGSYYALHGGGKPLLERAIRPRAFLSALPQHPLSIPGALKDHSLVKGYCKALGEIALQGGMDGGADVNRAQVQCDSSSGNSISGGSNSASNDKNSLRQRSSSIDSVD